MNIIEGCQAASWDSGGIQGQEGGTVYQKKAEKAHGQTEDNLVEAPEKKHRHGNEGHPEGRGRKRNAGMISAILTRKRRRVRTSYGNGVLSMPKLTKSETAFPTDGSLLKMLYLAMMDITKKRTGDRHMPS